ncbi:hypothetical protein N320_11437, partial [Buceros rhinoceros silvestris]
QAPLKPIRSLNAYLGLGSLNSNHVSVSFWDCMRTCLKYQA